MWVEAFSLVLSQSLTTPKSMFIFLPRRTASGPCHKHASVTAPLESGPGTQAGPKWPHYHTHARSQAWVRCKRDWRPAGPGRSQQSPWAPTLMSPRAQASGGIRCRGGFLICSTRVMVAWEPFCFLKGTSKTRNRTQTYKIHFSIFPQKSLKYYSGPDTRTLLTKAIGKPQTFAHKEGLPLPLRGARQIFKICLEVRNMYYLIRKYPGFWQIRRFYISCERKQFINVTFSELLP